MIAALLAAGAPDRSPTFHYHVDPASGNDSTGTGTKTLPWATLSKALTIANTGESIGMKAGTITREPWTTITTSRLRFGAYGTGTAPIVSGGRTVGSWSVFSGSTYSASSAAPNGDPPIVTFTSGGGVTTVLVLGSGAGSLTANQYFWASSVLYVHLGGTNPSTGIVEVTNDYILGGSSAVGLVWRGMEFRHAHDGGLWLTLANGHVIDNCAFRYITQLTFNGALYIRNGGGGKSRVARCRFDQLATEGVYVQNTQNVEIDHAMITNVGGIVGDQQSDGIQFEQNVLNNNSDGFWVHHNSITMGSMTIKGCFDLNTEPAISGTSATGLIEYNSFSGGNFGVALHSSGVTVRNNTFTAQTANHGAIWLDPAGDYTNQVITYNLIHDTPFGILGGTGSNTRQLTIAHNTIVDCTSTHISIDFPIWGIIKNNILWNTGANPSTRCMYIAGIAGGHSLASDYNLFNAAFTNYLHITGADYSTLAAWKSGASQDTHSFSSDPLFTNTGADDFTLTGSSPAIDAGVVVGGINQVVLGAAPDLGYLEKA